MISFSSRYWLCSTCFILSRVCRFFLFLFFSNFFVDSTTCWRYWGTFVSTYNKAVELLLGFYTHFWGVDVTGLIQLGKFDLHVISTCPLNYLLQSISVELVYQFLYFINGYLLYRYLEKVFEENSNGNRKGNRCVTTSQWLQKTGKWKIGMMKFLVLTLYLSASLTLILGSASDIIVSF